MVVAVDRVSPQTVHWQLLLQKADDLELREVGAVAHIWRGREESVHSAAERGPLQRCPAVAIAMGTKATCTCDGFSIPAVRRRRVRLAELALAHILLFADAPLVGLGVRVRVQVKGRGGQLGSPLTS